MAKKIEFTTDEIENAINVFKELSISFERDNRLFLEFKSRPISYLRRWGLLIMKYINNENYLYFINRFSQGIRNILRLIEVFDSCSWCKVTALTVIYALCGKAKLSIDACWGILSSVIDAIENILNLSNQVANRILSNLNSFNKRLSPYRLAWLICQQLGYCQMIR